MLLSRTNISLLFSFSFLTTLSNVLYALGACTRGKWFSYRYGGGATWAESVSPSWVSRRVSGYHFSVRGWRTIYLATLPLSTGTLLLSKTKSISHRALSGEVWPLSRVKGVPARRLRGWKRRENDSNGVMRFPCRRSTKKTELVILFIWFFPYIYIIMAVPFIIPDCNFS